MTVAPIYHECDIVEGGTKKRTPDECVTILRRDYRQMIIEIKAACVAAGGADTECLTSTR